MPGTTERADTTVDPTSPTPDHRRTSDPILLRVVRSGMRLTLPLAGHRSFPLWAVLHHRGRRSGREYTVPVGVRAAGDELFIALPFGERTQWVHNVLAAGGCTIRWRGEDIVAVDPAVVGAPDAAHAFPFMLRWMMRASGARQVLRMRAMDGGPST